MYILNSGILKQIEIIVFLSLLLYSKSNYNEHKQDLLHRGEEEEESQLSGGAS